jgi:hypothetical protein
LNTKIGLRYVHKIVEKSIHEKKSNVGHHVVSQMTKIEIEIAWEVK